MKNLTISQCEEKELLNRLRDGSVNVALIDFSVIDDRVLEFMPVARITSSVCLAVLAEEKSRVLIASEYKIFFKELYATMRFLKKKNELFDFMFYPECVL